MSEGHFADLIASIFEAQAVAAQAVEAEAVEAVALAGTAWACSECRGAGSFETLEEVTTDRGELLMCSDCREDFAKCETCELEHERVHLGEVHFGRYPHRLECEGCRDSSLVFLCNGCDIFYDPSYFREACAYDGSYCYDCARRLHMAECGNCCVWFGDQENECPSCHALRWEDDDDDYDDCGDGRTVHSYSYRPSFSYYGEGPAFMGIELEVECCQGDTYGIADWLQDFDTSQERFYLKEDGSLSNGFEIVFHPRSLEAWHDFGESLSIMLEGLRARGVKAWDRSSCGLHVHLSRDAFKTQSHLARYAMLISRNRAGLVEFARRESGYANFDSFSSGGVVRKVKEPWAACHGDALNLSGSTTVEFRIFRPSLASGRVMAGIELTHALWDYCGRLSASDVALGALSWDRVVSWLTLEEQAVYPYAAHSIVGGKFQVADTLEGSILEGGRS